MKIIWNASHRLRGFHAAPSARVTLVSEYVADDARTEDLGGNLLFATDSHGAFCDLELLRDKTHRNTDLPFVDAFDVLTGELETKVSEDTGVTWWFDETRGHLRVGFVPVVPATKWYRLGENPVWVGVGAGGQLTALVADGVQADDAGSLEAKWLDEIGAGDA